MAVSSVGRRCGGMHALRNVVAIAAFAALLASCASSASYQAAALQASEGGDQKAAVSLAKKEVARFSGTDKCSLSAPGSMRDTCAGLRRAGRIPDPRPQPRRRRGQLHPGQRGVEPDGPRDQGKCHRHGLSRRLRSVLESRRSCARHCRIQGRPCRGCGPVAVHVVRRPGCRSTADRSAIDRPTPGSCIGVGLKRSGGVPVISNRQNRSLETLLQKKTEHALNDIVP